LPSLRKGLFIDLHKKEVPMSAAPEAAVRSPRGRPRSFDRDKALDAAMRVFWAKGFAGASMSDLTAAMGIASPSLYAAFGSKEGLFQEAIAHYEATYARLATDVLEGPGRVRDQIEQVMRITVRDPSEQEPAGCMVVAACAQTSDLSPELAAALCEKRTYAARMMETRILRAVEEGELPAGVDARAVADFYATVQRGLAVGNKSGASADELGAVVTTAMAAWEALTSG
jgi:AcrR family transcriptional regulator